MTKHLKIISTTLLAVILFAFPQKQALAVAYSLGVGPVSVGIGGSNPPSFIRPYEYQASIIFENSEIVLGLTPGVFYAWRSSVEGPYVSVGPGLVMDANGITIGVTGAFGVNLFCEIICLMFEYRQAAGFVADHIISPYTVKIGFTHIL